MDQGNGSQQRFTPWANEVFLPESLTIDGLINKKSV
jgi:hypothetical protein